MTDSNEREKTRMVPPRLTLVAKAPEAPMSEPSADDTIIARAPLRPADQEAQHSMAGSVEGGREAELSSGLEAVSALAAAERRERLRIIEAVLFAASEPLDLSRIAQHLVEGADVRGLIAELQTAYADRGVNLVEIGGKWAFRTAEDLSFLLQRYAVEERKLSKAALETLAIIAYHQPVTRAEIEEVRGVTTSAGTIDILLETGWIRPRGRRRAPGRPVTYGTSEAFLNHFGLSSIRDLPGLAELKGSGLLDANLPPGFTVPEPSDVAALLPDELPLDAEEDDTTPQVELSFDDADSFDQTGSIDASENAEGVDGGDEAEGSASSAHLPRS